MDDEATSRAESDDVEDSSQCVRLSNTGPQLPIWQKLDYIALYAMSDKPAEADKISTLLGYYDAVERAVFKAYTANSASLAALAVRDMKARVRIFLGTLVRLRRDRQAGFDAFLKIEEPQIGLAAKRDNFTPERWKKSETMLWKLTDSLTLKFERLAKSFASNARALEADISDIFAEQRARINGLEFPNHKNVACWDQQETAALMIHESVDRVREEIEKGLPDARNQATAGWESI